MNQRHTQSFERHCDTALGWIARLRGKAVSEQDAQAFALWLAENDSHKLAMDNMLEMWDDLGSVKSLPFPAQLTQPPANRRNWLAASMALAACLVLAIFMWPQSPAGPGQLEFFTAIGERQHYELDDRSRLTLNTNSKVTVAYDKTLRRIELVRGEAYFEVARDESRPFEVYTGSAKVTALGTAFNIYRRADTASITVTEGVVQVTELGTGGRPAATEILHASQQLVATATGLKSASSVEVGRYTAWQEGKLIADNMPLPELIAQLGRYSGTRILITQGDVAALTISGVFQLDRPESILRALELSLDLQVVELGPSTLQLLKASQ